MESYGLLFRSDLVVEKLEYLPSWTESDQGRVIYVRSDKRCYIGQLFEWTVLGIYEYMIKDFHLFTDDQITGSKHAISALHVPFEFNSDAVQLTKNIINQYDNDTDFFSFDTTSNVQFVIDGIYSNLKDYSFEFAPGSVESEAVGFTASAFGAQTRINQLRSKTTKYWDLIELNRSDPNADFGYLLGLSPVSLHDAMIDLANYLVDYSADDLIVNLTNVSEKTNVQFAFDNIHLKQSTLSFVDIIDGPGMFDPDPKKYIHSSGGDPFDWDTPTSKSINVSIPNPFTKTVEMDDVEVRDVNFFPTETCATGNVVNTIDFTKVYHSPSDFYSTGLQQGIEIIRELSCRDEPRAMACDPTLHVASEAQFETSAKFEKRKDDALCCPITENNNDEDWNLIYNTWHRFSHEKGYSTQPAITTHLNSYILVDNGIKTTADTHSHNGFVSYNAYDCFEFEVTLTSDTTDNDMIGVVIAFHVDANGWEHTLTAVRIHGSIEEYMAVGGYGDEGTYVQWALVYNYRQDDEWLISDGTNSTSKCPSSTGWSEETGWSGTVTRVKIQRRMDSIIASCTDWDSLTGFKAQLSVNLDSDPRLQKFKGPQRYGYSANSTMGATWERQIIDCLDCGSTNCRMLQMYNINGCVVYNPIIHTLNDLKLELQSLDTVCPGCAVLEKTGDNLIDIETVWNTWQRWANDGYSTDVWEFRSNSVHATSNFQYLCYFYSSFTTDNYSFQMTVRSGDSDDDGICLVIAHGSGTNLVAMRTCGGLLGSGIDYFAIIYNYKLPGQQVIANVRTDTRGGWSGATSVISICRYKNIVTAGCSNFNSSIINPDYNITINLDNYPSLSGPKAIGFGSISQNDAYFSEPELYNLIPPVPSQPVPNIWDPTEHTLWTWNTILCKWEPDSPELPCGGYVDAPGICNVDSSITCADLDTEVRPIYDIVNHEEFHWDPELCIWNRIPCPDWSHFIPNTFYYNDITCNLFYYDCDRQWSQLI